MSQQQVVDRETGRDSRELKRGKDAQIAKENTPRHVRRLFKGSWTAHGP